jgi:hypothetical protein
MPEAPATHSPAGAPVAALKVSVVTERLNGVGDPASLSLAPPQAASINTDDSKGPAAFKYVRFICHTYR